MRYLHLAVFLIISISAIAQNLPPGIALPVMMSTTIKSKSAKSDEPIDGKLMQEVRLKDGRVLKRGAHIYGHIIANEKPDGASKIVLSLDKLEDDGQTIPLRADCWRWHRWRAWRMHNFL